MHKFILSKDQYYEAILQLRPKNKEVLDYVLRQLEKRKNIFISKKVELKKGVDLYISDKRFTRALGKKLKKSFRGELKLSRKLYGYDRQKSKKIYRLTVLFRLKNFDETLG